MRLGWRVIAIEGFADGGGLLDDGGVEIERGPCRKSDGISSIHIKSVFDDGSRGGSAGGEPDPFARAEGYGRAVEAAR